MRKHQFRRWTELEDTLKKAGLRLIDVSRDSTLDDRRTTLSIQYLTDLRSGRYISGPNERVIQELTAAIGCTTDDLMPAEDDEPEALAS